MSTNKKNYGLEAPKLPKVLDEIPYKDLQSDDFFEMGMFKDTMIENRKATKVTFDNFRFESVTMTETSLHFLELTDVIFERCDLSNLDFSNATIHRTEFRNCKIIGIDLTEATLRNVLFHNCIGDFANFRYANFKQVLFEESSLRSADFYSSTFLKVYMQQCNLDAVQLSATKLDGMDLSNCEFTVLGVGIEDIKGCTISKEQASVFANLFGLIVKE